MQERHDPKNEALLEACVGGSTSPPSTVFLTRGVRRQRAAKRTGQVRLD
jgi:hypothetical protein